MFDGFPTWLQGIDRQGRPVVWRQLGKCSIDDSLKHTTMKKLMQSQIWTRDQGSIFLKAVRNYQSMNMTEFSCSSQFYGD